MTELQDLETVLIEAGFTFWRHNENSVFVMGVFNEQLHKFLMGALPNVGYVIDPLADGCLVVLI